MDGELSRADIMEKMQLSDRKNFREKHLQPAVSQGFIETTIPEKPKSVKQQYRLTPSGKKLKDELSK